MKKTIVIFLLGTILVRCGSDDRIKSEYKLTSMLWLQNAVEYEAICYQTFQMAEFWLNAALEDKSWVATDTPPDRYQELPPAIIVDIDETLLNSTTYHTNLLETQLKSSEALENNWANQVRATALKGAVRFLRQAKSQGIVVFYITNRHELVKETTRLNLKNLGFPIEDNFETILTPKRNRTNKDARRKLVEKHYRTLMILGDDLDDFSTVFFEKSISDRRALVKEMRPNFGKRWFLLPNPLYGSWDASLFYYDYNVSESEKQERRIEHIEF